MKNTEVHNTQRLCLHRLILARVTVALFVLMAFSITYAQTKRREASQSFFSAQPYLVSISVPNFDETIKWYRDNLGFTVIRQKDLPKLSLRVAFIELNGFQLEVIEFKQSVPFETIQKQFPNVDDRAKVQGFGKLAFLVDDIEAAAARLKRNEVKFIRQISYDEESGTKWFIVVDNSGNWIQFFQKVKAG